MNNLFSVTTLFLVSSPMAQCWLIPTKNAQIHRFQANSRQSFIRVYATVVSSLNGTDVSTRSSPSSTSTEWDPKYPETKERISDLPVIPAVDFDFDAWFWGGSESGDLSEAVFATDERPIILFDGECGFCDGAVNFFMDHDATPKGSFRFAAQQSDMGKLLMFHCGIDPETVKSDVATIVYLEKTRHFTHSDAVIKIASNLDGAFPLAAVVARFFPSLIRDQVYGVVSRNRHIFGQKDECRLPEEDEIKRFIDIPQW